MTNCNPTPARRFHWRRLFQFRLRTLLILTTIIAIWLGGWSYKARQQREAVAALRAIGAVIDYDTRRPWTTGRKKWPQWLLKIGGADYIASVRLVLFDHSHGIDADLKHLKGLPGLQVLWLDGSQVTDAGMEHLKHLTALQELNLKNTQVTNSGLEHLKGLTALQKLDLSSAKVTDAGVARLQKALPNCHIVRRAP